MILLALSIWYYQKKKRTPPLLSLIVLLPCTYRQHFLPSHSQLVLPKSSRPGSLQGVTQNKLKGAKPGDELFAGRAEQLSRTGTSCWI